MILLLTNNQTLVTSLRYSLAGLRVIHKISFRLFDQAVFLGDVSACTRCIGSHDSLFLFHEPGAADENIKRHVHGVGNCWQCHDQSGAVHLQYVGTGRTEYC